MGWLKVARNFTGGGSGPTIQPASFGVATSDTIPVPTDSNSPGIFTGFTAVGPLNGFTLDAPLGAMINTSGRTLSRVDGTLSYQPDRTGGGTPTLEIASERSPDGVAWTDNPGSLRSLEIPGSGESFKTLSSFATDWLPGEYIRFKFYETGGGGIVFEPPSASFQGETIVGLSVYWALVETA